MPAVPLIIDLSGYIALVLTAFSFALKSDRALQFFNLAGLTFWTIHFGLLGSVSACLMFLLAAVMIVGALRQKDRLVRAAWWVNLALVPVTILLIAMERAGPQSLAPTLGGFFINTGVARCRGHMMTAMIVVGEMFWIATSVLYGSLPATVGNIINLAALTIRTGSKIKMERSTRLHPDS